MVLVCHEHKFIFLKTRKTAGTSVEMYLQPFCTPPDTPVVERTHAIETDFGIVGARLIGKKKRTERDQIWKNHMLARNAKFELGPEIWDAYRKITVVRNPFDRMVSYFHWKDRDVDFEGRSAEDLAPDFKHFLREAVYHNDYAIAHVEGEYIIDDVVRYEHLIEDLEALVASLELDTSRTELPWAKKTRATRSVAGYYDDETIAIVRKKMAWVFNRFGYAPEPPGA